VRYTITAKVIKVVYLAILAIPSTPPADPYRLEDGADVAETRYRLLGIKGLPVRLIMRR
jgi:hypothetical protein